MAESDIYVVKKDGLYLANAMKTPTRYIDAEGRERCVVSYFYTSDGTVAKVYDTIADAMDVANDCGGVICKVRNAK